MRPGWPREAGKEEPAPCVAAALADDRPPDHGGRGRPPGGDPHLPRDRREAGGHRGPRPRRHPAPRRAPRPPARRRRSSSTRAPTIPVGALDITFYRDDLSLVAQQPIVKGTADPVRPQRPHGRARGRRPVHGPHDPRRDGRADRLRAAAGDPARGPRRPRPPRAARSAPTTSARTCRRRARRSSGSSSRRSTARTASRSSGSRVLEPVADARRMTAEVDRPPAASAGFRSTGATATCSTSTRSRARTSTSSCARPTRMHEVLARPIPKVPALRGTSVTILFYEASTRTRVSFEVAAKNLSADVVNIAASSSSVSKGGVARRHGAHDRGAGRRHAGDPPPGVRARRTSRPRCSAGRCSTAATAGTRTRRRRCWTCTRCGRGCRAARSRAARS